jgi:hypothetical protein
MKTKWQSLAVFLVICVLASACGKDNKTAIAAAPAAPTPVVNTPTTNSNSPFVTASSWEDFKTKVAAGTFSAPTFSNIDYIYQQCSSDSSKFLGIFTFQTNTCSSSFTRSLMAGQVIREDGLNSKTQVVNFLNGLIGQVPSSLYYRQLSASAYQFQVGSTIYVVNLAYPAEANPTYKTSVSSGSGYQMSNFIAHGM